MAVQALVLKIKGLFTNFNEFSSAPEGSLTVAKNIEVYKDNIAEPRRGFERLATGYSSISNRTDKTFFYQDKEISHKGTLGSANTLSYFSSGVWTDLSGTYSARSGYKMRSSQSNQNFYFASSAGIYKMDVYNSTPTVAGAYKALDVKATLTGSSGFLADQFRVVYRVVWGYEDANKNLVFGSPSQREDISNNIGGAATRNISLAITIPTGVTTSWFYQIYRSAQFGISVEPNDELQLVYQSYPSSGEISAKTLTVVDSVTDALKGAALYTSPSQQGIGNSNEQPPMAADITSFRGCTFYLNTVSKHRYYLTLIATGGTSGVTTNDTIGIGGVTYTAKTTETASSAQFKASTSVTDPGNSVSQNIRDTALSLIRVINQYASSTVYAYYLSGTNDLPGKILLEERSIGGASFAVVTSRATCWNPTNIPTSGTAQSSTNSAFLNGLAWSKPDEPEHVPLGNFQKIGSGDKPGRRIIPLREALIIEKDDGIYRLTGYYPNFNIELLDSSAKLIGAETADILDNQIYCLSDQGVIAISDGAKIISYPIEGDIKSLVSQNLDLVKSIGFGVGYESDRKYYLFLPTSSGDTYCTQAYVYNVLTKVWTRHVLDATCGVVYNNNLYLGNGASHYIWKDRKNFTYLDYADYGYTTNITAISGTTVTLSSGVDDITVGDILYQSSSVFSVITGIDSVQSTITVETDPGFSVASCDVLYAIDTDIQWVPISSGNPGIQKQYHTVQTLFKEDFTGTATLAFQTDLQNNEDTVSLTGASVGAWGLFTWGSVPWGGFSLRSNRRQWIPRGKQRSSELLISFRHRYGFSSWQLQGISVYGEIGSENTTR